MGKPKSNVKYADKQKKKKKSLIINIMVANFFIHTHKRHDNLVLL